MIVSSFKIRRSPFSNICGCISLLLLQKVVDPSFIDFNFDHLEDFLFPSIKVIPGYEISFASVGSKCSTFYLFINFNFSSGENSRREDFLYDIIFLCVKFGISKVKLDLYKWLSVRLYFLYSFFVELKTLVKC